MLVKSMRASPKAKYFVTYGFSRNAGDGDILGPSAAHGAADAGEQFSWAEGLGHVIVGAKLKQENFVLDFGVGAQHHDRHGCRDRLNSRQSSLPERPGSFKSRSTALGCCLRKISNPEIPSEAI